MGPKYDPWDLTRNTMLAPPDGGNGAPTSEETDDLEPQQASEEELALMADMASGTRALAGESEDEEPTTGETSQEPVTEPTSQAAPPPAGAPQAKPEGEGDDLAAILASRQKIGDEEFTIEELLRNGRIAAALQSARQLPTLQTKIALLQNELVSTRSERAMPRDGAPPTQEGQPPQPAGPPRDPLWGLTAAEYEDVTTSAVDKLKKAGLFGEDGIFAEEFPQLAKEAAFLAITYPQVVQANKMMAARLIQLEKDFKTYRIDSQVDDVQPGFIEACNRLAAEGGFYTPLATEQGQMELLERIGTQGPASADQLRDPVWLGTAWVNSIPPAMRAELAKASQARSKARQTTRASARTETQPGGSSSAASAPDDQRAEMARVIKGVRGVAGSA